MSRDQLLLEAFADELKFRRIRRKLSQEALAGINRTYVAKLELSKNQPTLGVMHALAVALDIDLSLLLEKALGRYEVKLNLKRPA